MAAFVSAVSVNIGDTDLQLRAARALFAKAAVEGHREALGAAALLWIRSVLEAHGDCAAVVQEVFAACDLMCQSCDPNAVSMMQLTPLAEAALARHFGSTGVVAAALAFASELALLGANRVPLMAFVPSAVEALRRHGGDAGVVRETLRLIGRLGIGSTCLPQLARQVALGDVEAAMRRHWADGYLVYAGIGFLVSLASSKAHRPALRPVVGLVEEAFAAHGGNQFVVMEALLFLAAMCADAVSGPGLERHVPGAVAALARHAASKFAVRGCVAFLAAASQTVPGCAAIKRCPGVADALAAAAARFPDHFFIPGDVETLLPRLA
jgi:hypothetical protein